MWVLNLSMLTVGLVFFIGFIVLMIFDLVMVLRSRGSTATSVSVFLVSTAFKSPVIAIGWGTCIGHLFFYMYRVECGPQFADRLLVAACGAGFALGCAEIVRALRR